jgi:hypothetical protein
LHALAASFQPNKVQQGHTVSVLGEDHRYIDFFPNTPHGTWSSTSFDVVHFFRERENTQTAIRSVDKETRQWVPIAKNRPEREVHFIGVSSSVPAIELSWPRSKITYITNDLNDAASLEVRQKAGYILNRDYTRYHNNRISAKTSLIGAEFQGVNYSALSMGAGEQRLFEILKKIKSAGSYALILIDEVDLLLHTDALHRFLSVLNEYAEAKNLQIIFTTHRESVVNFDSFVAIRHIYRTNNPPYKVFCFEDTKPDALARLTGEPHRPLSVYCEDDVSTAIIEKIALQAEVRRFVEISCFGAAKNGFTMAAALLLNNQVLDNSLFVLDGDVYQRIEERQRQISLLLTGDSPHDDVRRTNALNKIVAFESQHVRCPEHELHSMIITQLQGQDPAENEVIRVAQEIGAVLNAHNYVDDIITKLGENRTVGLRRVIDVAAKSPQWGNYVAPIRAWLDEKSLRLVEEYNEN